MDLELLQSLFGVFPLYLPSIQVESKKKPGCWDSVKGEYDRLIEVKMTMTEGNMSRI